MKISFRASPRPQDGALTASPRITYRALVNKWTLIGLVAAILGAAAALVVPRLLRSAITVPTPAGMPDLAKADWSSFLGKFDGRFESSGAGGTWVLEQGICYSGELDGFFGVRLKTKQDDGMLVKLVKDPIKGWTVIANEPDGCRSTSTAKCLARLYEAADCSTFAIDLAVDTQKRTQFFGGSVAIDCTYHGAHLVGKATIKACGRG